MTPLKDAGTPARYPYAVIGSAANLTVVGIAERSGIRFAFVQYLAYALPMMIVSIANCHLYVWLRYF